MRSRYFSVISIVLMFFFCSRMTLQAAAPMVSNFAKLQKKKVEKTIAKDSNELAYDTSSPNPVLEDTSNISSFNQKKYSCSDEGTCEEDDDEVPCKACAIASGVNCGISVFTFVVAVVAMVIAALVIANAGDESTPATPKAAPAAKPAPSAPNKPAAPAAH